MIEDKTLVTAKKLINQIQELRTFRRELPNEKEVISILTANATCRLKIPEHKPIVTMIQDYVDLQINELELALKEELKNEHAENTASKDVASSPS